MKTIRNAALSALCLALVTAAAPTAKAGCGPYGFQGGYGYGSSYQYGTYAQYFTKIPAGATITIPGYFGEKPGHVFLFVAGAKYPVKVIACTPKFIKLLMPFMKVAKAAPGRLLVFGLHGRVYGSFPVMMLPPVINKTVVPPVKAGVASKQVPGVASAGGQVQPKIIIEPAPAKKPGQAAAAKTVAPPNPGAKSP